LKTKGLFSNLEPEYIWFSSRHYNKETGWGFCICIELGIVEETETKGKPDVHLWRRQKIDMFIACAARHKQTCAVHKWTCSVGTTYGYASKEKQRLIVSVARHKGIREHGTSAQVNILWIEGLIFQWEVMYSHPLSSLSWPQWC